MKNLQSFKSHAQTAQSYLQERGIEVSHLVLLEALSRYEGHRDYRTFKAALNKAAPPAPRIPQLLGAHEVLYVFVETHGAGGMESPAGRPEGTLFCVTQESLNELYGASQLSTTRKVDLDGEFISRHYLGNEWHFGYDEVCVSGDSFYAKGVEDHSDAGFETNSIQLPALVEALKEAKRIGANLIFWDYTEEAADRALENVKEADEGGDTRQPLAELFDEATLAKRLCWSETFVPTSPAR